MSAFRIGGGFDLLKQDAITPAPEASESILRRGLTGGGGCYVRRWRGLSARFQGCGATRVAWCFSRCSMRKYLLFIYKMQSCNTETPLWTASHMHAHAHAHAPSHIHMSGVSVYHFMIKLLIYIGIILLHRLQHLETRVSARKHKLSGGGRWREKPGA